MKRRTFLAGLAILSLAPWAQAGALDGISLAEAEQALRESLAQGAQAALAKLGSENGYYANPQVKIEVPKKFRKADAILRNLGEGKRVDDLVLAMNRAAEMAVPKVEKMVAEGIRTMNVEDAKAVLSGGGQSITEHFRKATQAQFSTELLPIIKGEAEASGLTRAYHELATKLVQLAGIQSEQAMVEGYVAKRALEGLYLLMGAEERALRANPNQYAGGLIGKVFSMIN
jgi:hypothetical protein